MKFAPVHPFFVAAYPVLAAAAGNRHLGVTPSDLLFPLALALATAGLVWFATGTFFSDPSKRGLVATLVLGFIFWYGYLFAGLGSVAFFTSTVLHEWVFPVGVLVTASGIALVARARTETTCRTSSYLNLMLAILLVFPTIGIGRHLIAGEQDFGRAHLSILNDSLALEKPLHQPDMYFIVLDAYTGSRSLNTVYDFDNTYFEGRLRELGFIVPEYQRSNYVVTFLTLASILNWEYVQDLVPLDPRSPNQTPVYSLIEENRTVAALQSLGYQFVFLPTSYPMSRSNRFADLKLRLGRPSAGPGVDGDNFRSRLRRFTQHSLSQGGGCCNFLLDPWLRSTAFYPISLWAHRWLPNRNGKPLPLLGETAEQIIWKFAQLETLPKLGRPLFVFAHLILPHEPLQFHTDCTLRRSLYWPSQISPWEEERVRRAYLEQLQCANRLVLQLVEELLARSDLSPVILLQSDHGYARFEPGAPRSLAESRTDQIRERIDVFAAYHLPGVDPAAVPEDLTAVNLFRLVLREYFGANLPLIEDATYWSAFERPYDFVRLWPPEGAAESGASGVRDSVVRGGHGSSSTGR